MIVDDHRGDDVRQTSLVGQQHVAKRSGNTTMSNSLSKLSTSQLFEKGFNSLYVTSKFNEAVEYFDCILEREPNHVDGKYCSDMWCIYHPSCSIWLLPFSVTIWRLPLKKLAHTSI